MRAKTAGALSGAMAAASLPPFDLWPLGFVALVPLGWALSDPESIRSDAVAGGLAFGAVFYGLLLHWAPFTLHGLVSLGALSGLFLLGILAGVAGIQGLVLRRLLVRSGPLLALPAVWGGTEFLLAHFGPLAMPWTPLGLALAAVPEVAGPAEWIGVRGLSMWIAGVNGVALLVLRGLLSPTGRSPRTVTGLLLLLALVGVPALWGKVRAEALATRPLPSVLVVQLDLPREQLLIPELRDRRAGEALDRVLSGLMVADHPVAFALLPEAPFASPWDEGRAETITGYAARMEFPFLVGSHLREEGGLKNALLLVGPDGEVRTVHGKTRLVPLAEWPGLEAGPRGGVLELGGTMVGVLICSESSFGGEARRLARGGADLLLNPTNDGWFRPGMMGRSTAAHAQHRAHLVMRAVETRKGAVRSPLGGELLVVGPTGEVLSSEPRGGEGAFIVHPLTSPVTSGFVRLGDLSGWLSGLLLLIAFFRPRLSARVDLFPG